MADPFAEEIGKWIHERFPEAAHFTDPEFERDLGVDSVTWLDLAAEIENRCGVWLADERLVRIRTVSDLRRELNEAALSPPARYSPFAEPEALLGSQGKRWLAPLNALELGAGWSLWFATLLAMRIAFRLRVSGREHLPERAPFVLAPHHQSYLDPFAVGAALRFAQMHSTYWATCVRVANGPIAQWFRRWTHVVPIDGQLGAATSLAYGAAILKRKQNLVWFPEGRLAPDGKLLPLKRGLGLLLEHYPVPVVPVMIHGTFEALPLGRAWPRFVPLHVVFHPPLDPQELATQGTGPRTSDRITSALQRELARIIVGW
jgi:long-chain acyl-CoA synthetase